MKEEKVCQFCGGSGEIITDTYDYRGEHLELIEKCECTLQE